MNYIYLEYFSTFCAYWLHVDFLRQRWEVLIICHVMLHTGVWTLSLPLIVLYLITIIIDKVDERLLRYAPFFMCGYQVHLTIKCC